MAKSLVLLEEVVVSGSTGTVTLGDDKWSTAYDVYTVKISGVKVDSDDALSLRILTSGSAQTGAGYQEAKYYFKSDTGYSTINQTGQTQSDVTATIDSGESAAAANANLHLFNFNNASEYSYVTIESTHFQYNDNAIRGFLGTVVHTAAEANDGLLFKTNGANNFTAGTFSLYGLNK